MYLLVGGGGPICVLLYGGWSYPCSQSTYLRPLPWGTLLGHQVECQGGHLMPFYLPQCTECCCSTLLYSTSPAHIRYTATLPISSLMH